MNVTFIICIQVLQWIFVALPSQAISHTTGAGVLFYGRSFILRLMKDICAYFEVEDTTQLTWAHRVNNRYYLDECCADDNLMILEGDIWHTPPAGTPYMADKASELNDLDFATWINAIALAGKGAKLDFHSPSAVEPCLQYLATISPMTPLILHADVFNLLGESSNSADIDHGFEPEMFIHLAQEYFPSATLSIGWSLKREQDSEGKIEEILIEQMTDLVLSKLGGVAYTIEFRAGYTPNWERGAAMIFEPIDGVSRPDFGENVVDGIDRFRRSTFQAA